jgi:hypothetical protein
MVKNGLENRMVEVQTTLVAGPRNHLYRTGHPLIEDWPFLFALSQADLDHLGNFANDLHVEAVLHGGDDDTLKETA